MRVSRATIVIRAEVYATVLSPTKSSRASGRARPARRRRLEREAPLSTVIACNLLFDGYKIVAGTVTIFDLNPAR